MGRGEGGEGSVSGGWRSIPVSFRYALTPNPPTGSSSGCLSCGALQPPAGNACPMSVRRGTGPAGFVPASPRAQQPRRPSSSEQGQGCLGALLPRFGRKTAHAAAWVPPSLQNTICIRISRAAGLGPGNVRRALWGFCHRIAGPWHQRTFISFY